VQSKSSKLKTKIPLYHQSNEAVGGIFIFESSAMERNEQTLKLGTHRDDFFIFFVLTQGRVAMRCDMTTLEVSAPGLMMIKPFQIHSPDEITSDAAGYYISAAPFLIPNTCFQVFQNLKIDQQAQQIGKLQQKEILDTVALLQMSFTNKNHNKTQIINGLFNALVYHFANSYQLSAIAKSEPKKRSWLISANFKKLIVLHGFLENPSFFAKKLNISTSHLNDCVNIATGKSVTYSLQSAMVIEAQRLLYYTPYDVKEIAFTLGFEDHTYFSRLFKKITGETPLMFRRKFRE